MERINWLYPLAFLSVGLCPTCALGQVPNLPGWDLVWNDEFDASGVDTAAWELLDRKNSFNNEKQYYRPEQISTDNGNLRITATDVPLDGKDYRSGRLWTRDQWTYGRFEARINLPTTQGLWPAFWLNSRVANWPTGGEIDIMENRGSEPYRTSSAYHWGSSVSAHQFTSDPYTATVGGNPVNFHDGFHTYAAEWEPEEIRFYVDGNLHFTVTDTTAPIHSTPKSVILNLAVGGNFGGDPDATTVFPQHLDVDYVRVWQRPGAIPVSTINSSFETQYDAWSRFNNSNNNVVVSSQVAAQGSRSLKLSGRSTGSFNFSGATQSIPITGGTKLRANVESLVRSSDSIVGTGNYAKIKLEYYSQFGASHSSADFLGETELRLADTTSPEDVWVGHELLDASPSNAVEARMTFIFLQPGLEDGSVYFDNALLEALPSADFNLSGSVDGSDLVQWQNNYATGGASTSDADYDGDTDGADFLAWQRQLEAGTATASASSTIVPEPTSTRIAVALIFFQLLYLSIARTHTIT